MAARRPRFGLQSAGLAGAFSAVPGLILGVLVGAFIVPDAALLVGLGGAALGASVGIVLAFLAHRRRAATPLPPYRRPTAFYDDARWDSNAGWVNGRWVRNPRSRDKGGTQGPTHPDSEHQASD